MLPKFMKKNVTQNPLAVPYLQCAEKAQHAAQVGCHSHRRRGQASTRAHFRAATLNRATENLLFFDLRC